MLANHSREVYKLIYLYFSMEWNILDCLNDEIYLTLNVSFIKFIKQELKQKKITIKSLSNEFNLNKSKICSCLLGNSKFHYPSLLLITDKLNISRLEVEKNIKGISLKHGRVKIFSPKFRIFFNSELSRLLGHICGDGSLSSRSIVTYSNKEDSLITNFINLVREIFGDVECNVYLSKDGTKNVYLPKLLGKFFMNCFPELKDSFVPLSYFTNNLEMIPPFLGAIFDDEGCVSVSSRTLKISMKNYPLIYNIKFLFEKIGIETAGIIKEHKRLDYTDKRFIIWNLCIYRRMNFVSFSSKIILVHPKKNKLLNKLINNYVRNHADYELRDLVLNTLKVDSMTSSELSNLLHVSLSCICKSMRRYERQRLVESYLIEQKRNNNRNYLVNKWKLK